VRFTGLLVAMLAAGAVYAKTVGTVVANGDPASDVLLQKDVFLPIQPPVCSQLKTAVESAASRAGAAGYPIKVAVIGSAYDLGTEPTFFGHPAEYGKFLGEELGTYSAHLKRKLTGVPLLIVMPEGLALWNGDARLSRVVDKIDVSSDADPNALARAALEAVQNLAAATGHPTRPINVSACSGGGTSLGPIVPFAVPVVLLLLVGLVLRFRRPEGSS
jgi:hypothetical protein